MALLHNARAAAPERECLVILSSLLNVTPGDFADVVRQARFRPVLSAAEFVTALEGECGVKEGVKVGIGFVHQGCIQLS